MYHIGISCIGSGVGQSVINSLRLSGLPIKTIGLGTNPYAFGAYDCDVFDDTPGIYDKDFIPGLIETCNKHRIDLLIPGLDDEVMLYAAQAEAFEKAGIKTICCREPLAALCQDKQRMSVELNAIRDVFAKSYDKAGALAEMSRGRLSLPLIAKPRGGFASRGIEIILGREDIRNIPDDAIIQELVVPAGNDPHHDLFRQQLAKKRNLQVAEISIQLVACPEGRMMGKMASYNKLQNGVPVEIVPIDRPEIWDVVDRLTPHLLKMGLQGPLNIQGRLTESGLRLFEMNPRFTGITGLRALMGFNEVEACVKEWLNIDRGKNRLSIHPCRFGVRQTADKSLPLERNAEVAEVHAKINGGAPGRKKIVFLTGSDGFLGRNLLRELISFHGRSFDIWAFGREKYRIERLFPEGIQACFDSDDLLNGRIPIGQIDILVHLAFARPHKTFRQIAEGLRFTQDLLTRMAAHQIPAVLNISSQSVYGQETAPPWNENTPAAPMHPYSQAKYAAELMLKSLKAVNRQLGSCSLRMSSICGCGNGAASKQDFLYKIVRLAYQGQPLMILGGNQLLERLDVRDAVSALTTMLHFDPTKWKPEYNVGPSDPHSLMEFAERVVAIAPDFNGGIRPDIIMKTADSDIKQGLDCSRFRNETGWRPQYRMEETIVSLFEFFRKQGG